MSNSVDEAVFDYFSLLLSEAGQEESTPDEHETRLEKQTVKQEAQVTYQEPVAKPQRQPLQAPTRPVVTQAAPPLNKLALEQLLAPVAELETEIEAETLTQIQDTVADVTVEVMPARVDTVTQVQPLQQVKEEIEEKLETSANIKHEESLTDKLDLAVSPKTQTGITPPGVTEQLVEQLDDEFQVLFFKVAGLTLAVPLVSLGGIVKLERINHIMGRPAWYLGVQTHRDSQLNVVDSGAWVMPEKYDEKLAQSVDYQYIVLLEDSNWGLACESLVNSVRILKSEVNWRTKAGKRPWLAGVVKEQMCGILHVQALIELLNLGLGSQDSIG